MRFKIKRLDISREQASRLRQNRLKSQRRCQACWREIVKAMYQLNLNKGFSLYKRTLSVIAPCITLRLKCHVASFAPTHNFISLMMIGIHYATSFFA